MSAGFAAAPRLPARGGEEEKLPIRRETNNTMGPILQERRSAIAARHRQLRPCQIAFQILNGWTRANPAAIFRAGAQDIAQHPEQRRVAIFASIRVSMRYQHLHRHGQRRSNKHPSEHSRRCFRNVTHGG